MMNMGKEMKTPEIDKWREEMTWLLAEETLLFPTDNFLTSLGTQIVLDRIQAKKISSSEIKKRTQNVFCTFSVQNPHP